MSSYEEVLAYPFMKALDAFRFPLVCPENSAHIRGRYFRYWQTRNIARCYGGSCSRGSWTIIDLIMHYKDLDYVNALKLACETLEIKYRAANQEIDRTNFLETRNVMPGEYRDVDYKVEIVPSPVVDWRHDRFRFAASLYFSEEKLLIANQFYDSSGRPVPAEPHLICQEAQKINKLCLKDNQYGAWVCINPVSGQSEIVERVGRKLSFSRKTHKGTESITRFSYLLIESDIMSTNEQYSWLKISRLPILSLTHSGGKSLHAVVLIDAPNEQQYTEKCHAVYTVLQATGFSEDPGNANANRYTRLPGIMRGNKPQYLIDTSSWEKYKNIDQWLEFMIIKPTEVHVETLSPKDIWKQSKMLTGSLPYNSDIRVYKNTSFVLPFISLNTGQIEGIYMANKGQCRIIGNETYYPCIHASLESDILYICPTLDKINQYMALYGLATYYLSYEAECLEIWPIPPGIFSKVFILINNDRDYINSANYFIQKNKNIKVEVITCK